VAECHEESKELVTFQKTQRISRLVGRLLAIQGGTCSMLIFSSVIQSKLHLI